MDTSWFHSEDAFILVKVKADTWGPQRIISRDGKEVSFAHMELFERDLNPGEQGFHHWACSLLQLGQIQV